MPDLIFDIRSLLRGGFSAESYRLRVIALVVVSLLALGQASTALAGYTFTNMVPTGFYNSGPGNFPAINNLGQVASWGYANGNYMQIGLSNSTQTVGLLNPTAYSSVGAGMWLNDAGQVTTRANAATFLVATTNSVTVVPNSTGWTLDDDNFAVANELNSPIAWVGYQGPARTLFLTSGSTTQTLATSGTTYSELFSPFINTSDTVCYTAQFGNQTAIYTTNGITNRTIAITSATDSSVIGKGIDSSGDVLWQENLTNGSEDLWLTSPAGTSTLIADTTGAYANFSDPYSFSPALSPSGKIAFIATLKNGNVGIFTGEDAVADKVIEQGDLLFGGTVGSVLSIGSEGINNNGSIAFIVNTQSQDYVVRADLVPEPASLLVLVEGSGLLILRRRHRTESGDQRAAA